MTFLKNFINLSTPGGIHRTRSETVYHARRKDILLDVEKSITKAKVKIAVRAMVSRNL